MKMDVLKCKTVDGVLEEVTFYALVYNLVRVVMLEAARRQGRDVERISFMDALRWPRNDQASAPSSLRFIRSPTQGCIGTVDTGR
jgi:hypothetical protein